MANYTPAFKRTLLVEALKYIAAFSGQVAVIKYGGAAMVKESLKEAFAEDVALLKTVGLKPVVVHGGAPEITRTLEKLGERSEFVDGLRVTDATSPAGGGDGAHRQGEPGAGGAAQRPQRRAVGLSGKDGQLLKAEDRCTRAAATSATCGEVVEVNKDFLQDAPRRRIRAGHLAHRQRRGRTGLSVNADDVAAAVAAALGAKKLIYLTDVPGILESAPDGGWSARSPARIWSSGSRPAPSPAA